MLMRPRAAVPPVGDFGAHRFWRVYIAANNGDPNYTVIGELEFFGAGGSDLTDMHSGAAFSQSGNTVGSTRAFDNQANAVTTDDGSYWYASGSSGMFIGFAFDVEQPVRAMRIFCTRDPLRAPKDFSLQYSDDSETTGYTTAIALSSETGWSIGEWRQYG